MFGQPQQQYGYPQQGYPQQGYQQGYGQPPARPAVSMTPEQMLASIESQSSKGAKFEQPGTSISGIIENVTANQIRDFKSRQPKFFDDGQPQMQVLVTINTGVTDPMVEDDDGRRTVYIKGFGLQRHAWLQALHNAGLRKAAEVRPGDRFTATFTGFGEAKPGMNAPKLFEYVIEHQSPADLAMNQPQQPGMQQAQPAYPQQQYAPQQPTQTPNQGYQQPPVDPWNPPTQQQPQQPAQPVQLGQPQQQADPMKVNQLKAVGKSPQEIAALLGVPVEAVTAVTDQAQPQYHGGSEQMPETGEF
ncbi:hypothetical protein CJO32_10160 [Bifidobacterium longum]|jgi:hypothetical protein|uniref:hypothetical protein n=1 Tax=Bifidobacterium longum TaxID=216816 RepID=UPI000BA798FC|nr:hypothetical protein [Bifidobacterium longum]PAK16879.1 hypothetical protein CJO32_10160 [Bifidobacterium longum]